MFNLSTNAEETLNLQKNVGHDLRCVFDSEKTGEKGQKGENEPPQTSSESVDLELADPVNRPIFDICYNQSENKLFISGLDYLKTFKIFNYNY